MSTPLKDFRLGITESIDIWLDAVATANGCDKAQVARDVLKEWAKRKQHEHTVASRRFSANGLQPELFGDDPASGGLRTEDGGASRTGAAGRGKGV